MHITKIKVNGFRALKDVSVGFNPGCNVIVGDNEAGKSTLLEAINLALTNQINGRNINFDLHPFLFNQGEVSDYVTKLQAGENPEPPEIEIEVFFNDDGEFATLKGINNSLKEDVPGLRLRIELNDSYRGEFAAYIAEPDQIVTIPVEFYRVVWRSFAGADLSPRTRPLKTALIDTGDLRYSAGPQKYVLETVSDFLEESD